MIEGDNEASDAQGQTSQGVELPEDIYIWLYIYIWAALQLSFLNGVWEEDATKQKFVRRSAFSLNRGKAFSE